MQFEAKFYDNGITPEGSYAGGSTDHEFYNRWHPIKYTYLKKDSICGNRNILVIQFGKEEALKEVGDNKTGQDNFIIINLNKIIVETEQKGYYEILERKKQ